MHIIHNLHFTFHIIVVRTPTCSVVLLSPASMPQSLKLVRALSRKSKSMSRASGYLGSGPIINQQLTNQGSVL